MVKEGKASILFPSNGEVFYNPIQEFNRDMSINAIKAFTKVYLGEKADKAAKRAARIAANAAKKASAPDSKPEEAADPKGKQAKAAAAEDEEAAEGEEVEEDGEEEEEGEDEKVEEEEDTKAQAMDQSGDDSAAAAAPKGIKILEALAASGLRSIRYHKELDNVDHILCNDFSQEAVESMRRNFAFNGIDMEKDIIPNCGDASMVMYEHRRSGGKQFDVIDLDPYGSAAPFIDAAVQSIADGGLLCVTCTDMAVLAGNHGETCHAKYGSFPVRANYCHEMGLRIVLATLSQNAARYQRYIEPLLSCSIDFYCRLFVRVHSSAAETKMSASKLSYVFQCTGCDSFYWQPVAKTTINGASIKHKAPIGPPVDRKCPDCGGSFHIGGPFWNRALHDKTFVQSALSHVKANKDLFGTHDRMIGMLSVCSEELDDAFYYTVQGLSGTVHCNSPRNEDLCSALLNAGYKVSSSHAGPNTIKTNAPPSVLWDIMRCWVKLTPVKPDVLTGRSPAANILAKEPSFQADFTFHKDAIPKSKIMGLARYPENPEANWGPKAKAKKRKADEPTMLEKRDQKQAQKKPKSVKHIPCHHFRKGECARSEEECKYSHDMSLPVPHTVQKKKKLRLEGK